MWKLLNFLIFLSYSFNLSAQQRSGSNYGLAIEPSIGLENSDISGEGIENGRTKGTQFGIRAGAYLSKIHLLFDYSLMVGNYITTEGSRKYDYNQRTLGLMFGFRSPFWIRPFYTIIYDAKGTIIPGNTKRIMRGKGHKIGLSLDLSSFMLNVEMGKYHWDEIEENSVVTPLSEVDSETVNFNMSWFFSS